MREGCNDLNLGTTDCEWLIYYLLCVSVLIYLDHVIFVSRMRLTTVMISFLTKGAKRTWGFSSCSQSMNQETLYTVIVHLSIRIFARPKTNKAVLRTV